MIKIIHMEQFIKELNKALEWEYAAAIQYVQHAAVITGPEYDAIAAELIIHSNEEMAHAVTVSTMIADLGSTPSIDVEKIDVSKDAKAMLEQDLGGEELAIKMYKSLIAQAEKLGEYGKRRLLEDILMQEEEHRRDILSSLGR
jgi:bacterioferritin